MSRFLYLGLSLSLAAHVSIALAVAVRGHGDHAPPRKMPSSVSEFSIEVLSEPAPVPNEDRAQEHPPAAAPQNAPRRPSAAPRQAAAAAAPTVLASTSVAALTAQADANPSFPMTAEAQTPRFVMQAPAVTATQLATLSGGSSLRGISSAGDSDSPVGEGSVDTPATLVSGAPPAYTVAAEAAGIETELPLEVVIDRTGAVQSAHALLHTGYGLDEAALAAVRRYRFAPARRANRVVAVRMRWVMRFQLR